jgi:hypothetical protein
VGVLRSSRLLKVVERVESLKLKVQGFGVFNMCQTPIKRYENLDNLSEVLDTWGSWFKLEKIP